MLRKKRSIYLCHSSASAKNFCKFLTNCQNSASNVARTGTSLKRDREFPMMVNHFDA